MRSGFPAVEIVHAALLVTGTEVLEGRVRDQNGAAIAADLVSLGVTVTRTMVVGDAADDIAHGAEFLLGMDVDLLVVTGGLGPTHDDRTMQAIARVLGVPLALDDAAFVQVRAAAAALPQHASQAVRDAGARKQATLPLGARALPPSGTAPGAVLTAGGVIVVVLPGPPWECIDSWRAACATPELVALFGAAGMEPPVTLRLAGVVESQFIEALAGAGGGEGVDVGVCARPGELEVTLRPPGRGAMALEEFLGERFPGAIFSRDGAELEEVLGRELIRRGETLATAESCTGGMLGERLTRVQGASGWYAGGVIAYDNAVKVRVLGVAEQVLIGFGAVSGECAAAMAQGARLALSSTWAVSVTGIAGPGGGTPMKPVGLVYLAVAGPTNTITRELHLHGDRERVRGRAATLALHMVREALAG